MCGHITWKIAVGTADVEQEWLFVGAFHVVQILCLLSESAPEIALVALRERLIVIFGGIILLDFADRGARIHESQATLRAFNYGEKLIGEVAAPVRHFIDCGVTP
jgi:hypothetical protein